MITVNSPGTHATYQDHGRLTWAHLGVPASGAADPEAHALANALVENAPEATTIELALGGASLTFHEPATIAYAGADADLLVDGAPAPAHHTLHLRAGQTLTVPQMRGTVGYLALHGGIDAPRTLGSTSTCALSGLGPPPLSPGDTIHRASLTTHRGPGDVVLRCAIPQQRALSTVRFTPAPTDDVPAATRTEFTARTWTLSPESSRVGIRLAGSPLDAPIQSVASAGMVRGAIQLPPSGLPIVLGPDHGTTGGYPIIGVVVGRDLAAMYRAARGIQVRFVEVSHEDAPGPVDAPYARALDLTGV